MPHDDLGPADHFLVNNVTPDNVFYLDFHTHDNDPPPHDDYVATFDINYRTTPHHLDVGAASLNHRPITNLDHLVDDDGTPYV